MARPLALKGSAESTTAIEVTVTMKRKRQMAAAAETAGMDLSTWVRSLVYRELDREG